MLPCIRSFWALDLQWRKNMHNTDKYNQINSSKKHTDENWVDDLIERQDHDLEVEEEILSTVPNRIKHKYLDDDE